MKNTFRKSSVRFVKQKMSRFLAMFGIVFIGIFVIAGLLTTTPNIKSTIDNYYRDSRTIDINLKSTIGFNKDSIAMLNNIEGIETVEAINYYEKRVSYESNDLVSIIYEQDFNSNNYLNKLELIKGDPKQLASNEVLVEQSSYYLGDFKVGSTITIDNEIYNIVGVVSNSWHFAKEKLRTNTTLETVNTIIYKQIDSNNLVYTDIFIKTNSTNEPFSDAYFKDIHKVSEAISEIDADLINNQKEFLISLNPLLEPNLNNEDHHIITLNRNNNVSFATFNEFTIKVDTIIKIFPLFFLLVSSLVVLTTMTRLVDEERLQIGLLRALGYTKASIYKKYIIYAAVISISATLLGYLVGFRLLPNFIYNTFDNSFHLPPLNLSVFSILNTVMMFAMVLSIIITTIFAVRKTLNQKPANLLVPQAPKRGQRILLERIPFIWKRLRFKYKASLRNIFRYPKHLFMTVIGVSGSFALVFIALGLNYSIEGINDVQYQKIYKYDYSISINNLEEELTNYLEVNNQSYLPYYEISDYTIDSDDQVITYDIYVFEEKDHLVYFIGLYDYKSNDKLLLNDDGIIVTEQLAKNFNKNIGDTLKLEINHKELIINNIAEHYVTNKVYMTKTYYENNFELMFEPNKIMVVNDNGNNQDILTNDILNFESTNGIDFLSDDIEANERLLSQVIAIVIILVIAAGVLFIIIVYNLTNVNVFERAKELSTLKVLGYKNKEVSMYIYREINIMTFFGIISGIIVGYLLLQYVIKEISSANLAFLTKVPLAVYIISVSLIIAFTLLVQILMHFKMKKINMIEALKEY